MNAPLARIAKFAALIAVTLLLGCREAEEAKTEQTGECNSRRVDFGKVQFSIEDCGPYGYYVRVYGETDTTQVHLRTNGDIDRIWGQWSYNVFEEEHNRWSDTLVKTRRDFEFYGEGSLHPSDNVSEVCETARKIQKMYDDFHKYLSDTLGKSKEILAPLPVSEKTRKRLETEETEAAQRAERAEKQWRHLPASPDSRL
ncbi:MAG: hypothetical protein J6Y56_09190 [Fibrobacterales bacterium]|nr:hypothetical protein [Fibrobacterales bacterium]